MSPLPISRSALDKLGDRLAAADTISDDDNALLLDVLTAYGEALAVVRERLVGLGYAPTTRVKTTGVLINKLRRESGMKLKGVQDVAGARIVADCDRVEQDQIVARVVAAFADAPRPPSIKDRRKHPSHGYRAVHVIVFEDGMPVEVQVRTRLQDLWAQVVERLGDVWGRGIRYGDPPPDPDTPVPEPFGTRAGLWDELLELGDIIDAVEGSRAHELARQDQEWKAVLASVERDVVESLTSLLDLVQHVD